MLLLKTLVAPHGPRWVLENTFKMEQKHAVALMLRDSIEQVKGCEGHEVHALGTVHRSKLLALRQAPLHEHIDLHSLASCDRLAPHYIKVDFDVRVAVADSSHICQLWVTQLQQLPPLVLLYKASSMIKQAIRQL